jgi:N-acetylglucosamine-6-phosphate deacetylase
MTLAPELPGALELIDELVRRGITASVGHTDATAAEAHIAFDHGATTVTHLFNAMRPPHHRDPGVAYAALARNDVVVQMIVDGVHLAPETAETVWRAAHGRVAVVTLVASPADVRVDHHTLAGSSLTMDGAVRALVELGASIEDAVTAASTVPARVAGTGGIGSLTPGSRADVVVLDDDIRVRRTLIAAHELFAG